MAYQQPPDLEKDSKALRAEHRTLNRTPQDVINTVIKQNLPSVLGTAVKYNYEAKTSSFLSFENEKLGSVLQSYGNMLRSNPNYELVSGIFQRNIEIYDFMNWKVERSFKNLLSACFLPPSVELPHDDHIMMIFLVTSDLANKVLLSSGNAEDVILLIKWAAKVVKPRRHDCFRVATWLFQRWVTNTEELLDSQRVQCLMSNFQLQNTPRSKIEEIMMQDLPPEIPENQTIILRPVQQLYTVLCSELPDHDPFAAELNAPKGKPKEHAINKLKNNSMIEEIMHSYILDRFPDTGMLAKTIYSSKRTFSVYTDFSDKPLGTTMREYGELILKTDLYEDIVAEVKRIMANKNANAYKALLIQHVFPPEATVLYDRIMLICVLTSELINETVVEDEMYAFELFKAAVCTLQTKADIVEEGFYRLAKYRYEIKEKSQFDLLEDHSLISHSFVQPLQNEKKLPQLDDPYRPKERPVANLNTGVKYIQ